MKGTAAYMRLAPKKGLSMIETILVLVIAATLVSLVAPSLRMGIENRQAKQALENLRSIRHAVRMYEQDHGNLKDASNNDIDLQDLRDGGYLRAVNDYLPKTSEADTVGYGYEILNLSSANWCTRAIRFTLTGCSCDPDTNTIREIRLSKNNVVSDSVGFLGPTSSAC